MNSKEITKEIRKVNWMKAWNSKTSKMSYQSVDAKFIDDTTLRYKVENAIQAVKWVNSTGRLHSGLTFFFTNMTAWEYSEILGEIVANVTENTMSAVYDYIKAQYSQKAFDILNTTGKTPTYKMMRAK